MTRHNLDRDESTAPETAFAGFRVSRVVGQAHPMRETKVQRGYAGLRPLSCNMGGVAAPELAAVAAVIAGVDHA